MHRTLLFLVIGSLIVPPFLHAQDLLWFKGNTHCHTTYSDGDETPENVVMWYKNHGYHFLVITDHDVLTDIEPLDVNKKDDMKYTTQFIGKNGRILKEVFGTPAVYAFKGNELYVRAKIFSTSGEFACTQPVCLNKNGNR